ncbi:MULTISPECIES: ATP-binding cassette domain-containing protein [Kitasatospora]|uniref:ATP-binding cassette domain-containing protein n=1 Tax=Kitasatospora TaxID=2063 RepID=UPI000691F4F2|nr:MULTISPECIES: ATP-binding cassette domain-containing protein [Kitasatospora]
MSRSDVTPHLELTDVSKVYRGGKHAVDGLSLRLGPGLLGLLGPNGAGKSSLMRIVATVTRPTSGRITYRGADVLAHPDLLRRELGFLPQDFGVHPHLTSREFLSYLAAAKGLPARAARARIEELLVLVNLTEAVRRPLGAYSGGMLRRVGIAQALLGDPSVIVVDEPTAGLDPEERVRFRNLLSTLAEDRVVVLSTHIVSDIESVAGDIAVLAGGRLLRRGGPEELLRGQAGRVWEVLVDAGSVAAVQQHFVVSRMVRAGDGRVRLRLLADVPPTAEAVQVAPDLEDAYLGLVRSVPDGPAFAPSAAAARAGVRR